MVAKDNKKSTKKESKINTQDDNDYDSKNIKRLYRSKKDKMIAGVCGGVAEYLVIDPVWVRLIAILLLFFEGVGVLAYIILWILIPENPKQKYVKTTLAEEKVEEIKDKIKKEKNHEKKSHLIIGGILVILGILFLVKHFFSWFNWNIIWPVIIIALGLFLFFKED